MTTRSLLAIVGRRWYIVLVGLVAAGAAFLLLRSPGAYTAEARVAFVSPGISDVGQTDDGQLETLTAFAAAVEREYHDGKPSDRLAENATLYGAGVSQGVQALLPNTGGQWQMSFATAAIDLSVVGPSPTWVLDQRDAAVRRIQQITLHQQQASGVAPKNRITTLVIPGSQVGHVGPSKSTEVRGAAVLLLLGAGLSTAAAAVLDGVVSRRRHRRALSAPPPLRATRSAGGSA
jgi:hypothetical protein